MAVIATIVAGIAAIVSLKDKDSIVTTGVVASVIFLLIAAWALVRKDKAVAKSVAAVAAITLVATLVYGGLAPSTVSNGNQDTSTPSSPAQNQSPSNNTEPNSDQPVFQGTADIVAGQAIDLEVQSPTAYPTTSLAPADDLYIDDLAIAYDHRGYLAMHTGGAGSKQSCQSLLENAIPEAAFALPSQSYCTITSEGRIALLRFSQGEAFAKVGHMSYQVWDN
jgi:hypothetical protein